MMRPYGSVGAFTFGFIFDLITLGRIDNLLTIISHGCYLILLSGLLVCGVNDFFLEAANVHKPSVKLLFSRYSTKIYHFLLGALLSAFTILYFKSASLSHSFLFLGFLLAILLLNEWEPVQKIGPVLQNLLFHICLVSYLLYALPTVLGKVGHAVFALSILLSMVVSSGILGLLWRRTPCWQQLKRFFVVPSMSIYGLFIFLYLFRLIPPIPLSIQHIGIYHKVERHHANYYLFTETPAWKFWVQGDESFKARPGDRLYVFTRLFAPRGFEGRVFLKWQRVGGNGEWRTTDRIALKIVGGRDLGFRGYAFKGNYKEGQWRAVVETETGFEIGRIGFDIEFSGERGERQFRRLLN
ncbi:MAG: DUF2914 domain-containing protein [Myxococcota bacterium]|nr:DUF2914 domain-containing protein [Myxococcota bacterium]